MRGFVLPAAAAICVCTAVVIVGQTPTVGTVQEHARAGRHEQAWAALQQLPVSPASLRLGVEIGLQARRVDRALTAYERLVANTNDSQLPTLASIAHVVLDLARQDADPVARAESCRALMRAGDTRCKDALAAGVKDARWPARARLIAAASLAEKEGTGGRVLAETIDGITGHEQALVAEIASSLPVSLAVPVLRKLLASPLLDVQYGAAVALGEFDTPAARQALRSIAGQDGFSPARPAARLSLAKLGERQHLAAIGDALARLDGIDLARAGAALAAAGDPRGLRALEAASTNADADVRIEAAAAMSRWSEHRAHQVIDDALRTGTAAVRGHALDVVLRLRWKPSREMWKLLDDPQTLIRIKAAAVCLPPDGRKQPLASAR